MNWLRFGAGPGGARLPVVSVRAPGERQEGRDPETLTAGAPGSGTEPDFRLFENHLLRCAQVHRLLTSLREAPPRPVGRALTSGRPHVRPWSPMCGNEAAWNLGTFLEGPGPVPVCRHSRCFPTTYKRPRSCPGALPRGAPPTLA